MIETVCVTCGKKFMASRLGVRYCSADCRVEYNNQKISAERLLARRDRICEFCGAKFTPVRSSGHFCSQKCQRAMASRKRHLIEKSRREHTAVCTVCGKEFVSRRKNQKCCSPSCRTIYNKGKCEAVWGKLRFDENGRRIRTPQVRECIVCGKHFHVRYGKELTCSYECQREHWVRTQITGDPEKTKVSKSAKPIKCAKCGKEFLPPTDRARFCSPYCRYDFNYEKRKPLWRKDVRTCVVCGKRFNPWKKSQVSCSVECSQKLVGKVRTWESFVKDKTAVAVRNFNAIHEADRKKVIDPSTITTIEGYVEYVASLPVEERTAILADFDAELKEMTLEMIAKQNEGASGGN